MTIFYVFCATIFSVSLFYFYILLQAGSSVVFLFLSPRSYYRSSPIQCMRVPRGSPYQDFTCFSFRTIQGFFFFFYAIQIQQQTYYIRQLMRSRDIQHHTMVNSDSEDSLQQSRPLRKDFMNTKVLGKTRVMTENVSILNASSKQIEKASQKMQKAMLGVKQKLAQALKNMSEKENENVALRKQVEEMQSNIISLKSQLVQSKKLIDRDEKIISQEKAQLSSLQRELIERNKQILQYKVDRQLLLQQFQYYKKDIQALKKYNSQLQREIGQMSNDKYKQENSRLISDLKRIHAVMQHYGMGQLSKKIQGKHFLGAAKRQEMQWFGRNLIGEVQVFLKRQQVGHGNKTFTQNLIKFINLQLKAKQINKKDSKSCQKYYMQKPGNSRCKMRTSLSLNNQASRVKNQFVRSKKGSVGKGSIQLKQSLKHSIFMGLEQQYSHSKLLQDDRNVNYKTCKKILDEFSELLGPVLKEKPVKQSKVMKLTSQMSKNLLSLLKFD